MKTKESFGKLKMSPSSNFCVKMAKDLKKTTFVSLHRPFHPFRGWFMKNSFLAVTYIVIGPYIPNFTFLDSVVLVCVAMSIRQSVSLL